MTSRTSIITVAYNSSAVLPAMLASLPRDTEVIVVDNASSDHSADIATAAGAQVIRLQANRGFGPACNAGAAMAKSEFLLFLNPDAELDGDALGELEAAADRNPHASAFNPAIAGRDGRPYFKHRSVLLPRGQWIGRGWPQQDAAIPVLSGAALFCRRACFGTVGGFDERIFLYHEDDDLALRLKAECGPLLFVRSALVRHLEGNGSPRSAEVAAFKAWHMARSRVYAQRKHGVPHAFPRSLLAAAGKLLSPAIIVSRRKRAQALAFLRGVLSVR
ncbi:MAG: glycosyltransferase family 2 protein [Rhizobiaceae bacterium]|jgi:GT2 family glycosyltransferase|nr:glycosyltransferase family 2 protein [Rhizobiaceae bacterium]